MNAYKAEKFSTFVPSRKGNVEHSTTTEEDGHTHEMQGCDATEIFGIEDSLVNHFFLIFRKISCNSHG